MPSKSAVSFKAATRLLLLAALWVGAHPLFARDIPFLSGHVVDEAGILTASVRDELETELSRHASVTGNQVVVLVIDSLRGEVLEEFSLRAAETYGLGQTTKDNGALLLIARDDRKLRIEVGYGLEGKLTDALSSRIIRNEIVPQFRDGEFDAGVVAGTRAILQAIQGEYTIDESDGAQSETGESGPGHTIGEWVSKIFTFLFAAAFLLYAAFMGFGFLIALVQLGLFGESPVLFIFIGPFIALFALIPLLLLWDAAPTLPVYLAMLALLSGFKILLHTTRPGRDLRERFKPSASRSGSSASSAGGWSGSSSSTYSSSSSGGFSGGGGSFGGGGASGSW